MLWLGHIIWTRLYFGSLTYEDAILSIAPDLPMMLFTASSKPWSVIKTWKMYTWLYKLPHSLFVLLCIRNRRYREIYAWHILLDILSHTGEWSIEPFFPAPMKIHGVWDPVGW